MSKLNPEDLTVSSFETTADALNGQYKIPTIDTMTDPTAMTNCYYCLPQTLDGCY